MAIRIGLIKHTTLPYPINDQWHVDILGMYVPWSRGTFDWKFLFQPWQEHHLVVQKCYDLALFIVTGRFDQKLQCCLTAIIFCGAVCCFFVRLLKKTDCPAWPLIACAAAILLPTINFESATNGFMGQTYWCLFATTISAWEFAAGRFWWGVLACLAGIGTLVTGFVAAIPCAILLATDTLRTKKWRATAGKLAVLAAVCAIGIYLKADAPQQAAHRAYRFVRFAGTMLHYLAWPAYFSPWFAALNISPIVILAALRAAGRSRDLFGERLALLLAGVVFIHVLTLSYFRARMPWFFTPRYLDDFAPLIVANLLALVEVARFKWPTVEHERWVRLFCKVWCVAAVVGIAETTEIVYTDYFPKMMGPNRYYALANEEAYLCHDPARIMKINPPPAVSLDEKSTMPELPGLLADTNVMKLIPALWRLDHAN